MTGKNWLTQMPKYTYKCDTCGHDYVEYRDEVDPVWHTFCVVAGCEGKNQEVK